MPRQRVVVTGMGMVTGLGTGKAVNEAGFREGRTAFSPVTFFDVSKQRVKTAAQAEVPVMSPSKRVSEKQWRRMDRASRLLFIAAEEAWEQAGWSGGVRIPVMLGTTSGGMNLGEAFYRQAITTPDRSYKQATRVVQYQAQRQVLDIAEALGFSGPVTLIANACASGGNAIGQAFEMIRYGDAERVLTGGYDGLCQLVFAGFDSLQALSTTSCRPFDAQRDGLALGEGAAVLTMESLESAQKRGAKILGEVVGYGAATDAHHLTQPHPQGDAALKSMEEATRIAGISPEQVGYINAHGTGTPMNDGAEAHAISRWAGEHAGKMRVSSTKASIGHLLGAAGSVEAVICLQALQGQWLPPMRGTQTADPACKFELVREPAQASFDYALSNSFGFGGANATLIFRRWS
jgi:3-oxoacyl-[acyl-carrier-protein] synthase II